jgi:hypothetical protein
MSEQMENTNEEKKVEVKKEGVKRVLVRMKSDKVSTKITVWQDSSVKFSGFLKDLNSKSKRNFNSSEVFDHLVQKLEVSDIKTLQDKYYTSRDRFMMLLDQAKESGKPVSEESLLSELIDQHLKKMS